MTVLTPIRTRREQPEQAAALPSAKPVRRIILMSGECRVHGHEYHMEGTIFAPVSGQLFGEILWTNVSNPTFKVGLAGTELVRGVATEIELYFSGYQIDKPFIKERYRITLGGAEPGETGTFWGISEAYGVWDARLAGSYQIVLEYA